MNVEQAGTSWGTMEWIILAMFWVPVLYFFFHFSFRSSGAKRAVWQANLGMFCGLLGFLVLPGLLAIPLGHIARRRIKRSGGQLTGSGRATFGLVVGYILAVYLAWMAGWGLNCFRVTHANLAAIDRAKSTWAAATGATNGILPTREDLVPFMAGRVFPAPAADEIYEINPIGVKASFALVGPALLAADSSPPLRDGPKLPPLPPPTW